jgi:hypothetical protein
VGHLGSETVAFTGRAMTAADFAMHTRSECAVHRWDLVGRDDVGWAMPSQPELGRHAVTVLSSMNSLRESLVNRLDASALSAARLVIRSAPADELIVEIRDGSLTATWAAPGTQPADVECDPAQRLLLLWGRYEPSSPIRIHATGRTRDLVDQLLHFPTR